MNEIPIAYCTLEPAGQSYLWRVPQCPLGCGREHFHGAGSIHGNPRDHLGPRVGHCRPFNDSSARGYILVESTERSIAA